MIESQQVKWSGAKEGTWADPGVGRIRSIEKARRGFGPKGSPGPAALIELEHNGLTVWVSPEEISPA